MSLQLEFIPHTLYFRQPAGTSRGIYTQRKVWYLKLSGEKGYGIGECAPLPALSCDEGAAPGWMASPKNLSRLRDSLENDLHSGQEMPDLGCIPEGMPALRFAVETAFLQCRRNSLALWDTPFSRGEKGIPFNGLIWMGTADEMYHRIREKTEAGFRCLKLKIGALDFAEELHLLRGIRTQFSSSEVELRVDANGAFSVAEALEKLKRLSELELHSIEQPIRAGQVEELAELCRLSPLPVALDEELIGHHSSEEKRRVLELIGPAYIVLKPSLHGGISGTREWITLAQEREIGWWITSALESNVGLNAVAQLCGLYSPVLPQGLGTGQLFTENVDSPLYLKGDVMWFSSTHQSHEMESW